MDYDAGKMSVVASPLVWASPGLAWSLGDVVVEVVDLPVPGALSTRRVLVSSEAVAHTLRREIFRAGRWPLDRRRWARDQDGRLLV
jgi:hypothetical protein